ncbi:MAG: two-component system, OmpR family, sensor kinase [Actinomycetota bacterium]|nr:two-component system, OmpR family, sensor kinase [Actinomycetota bacterium]MDQ1503105.1 two-component system, OmpR family, sensor kinase [Actinomycetota bacterium]
MPLRVRLTLAYLVVAATLLAAGGILFTRQLHSGLVASVDTGLRTRADQLVQSVTHTSDEGINFQDDGTRLIAPRESFAQVLGPDGSVVESSEAIGGHPVLQSAELAAARQSERFLDHRLDGERVRLLTAPARRADGSPWVVVVGTSLAPSEEALGRVRTGLEVGGVLVVVAGALGSWLLAGAALRPVERMRREVADISAHDPAATIDVPATGDEIAALGSTMNELLGRLQRALRQERRLVADAGHELRTPLAILQMELELASRAGRTHEELTTAVTNAADETRRLARLAEGLLFLAGSDEGGVPLDRHHQPLEPVLTAAVGAARDVASPAVSLRVEAEEGLAAPVDALRLRQAVDNLLHNAVRAAPAGSEVVVRDWTDGGVVFVEVSDQGSGFPEDFLPHAFERFRRADGARTRQDGGAGIGLAIVRAIAEAHGGSAEVRNQDSGGAAVRIAFPG